MSLPWLTEDFKHSSKSRSRSGSKSPGRKPRVDEFGRTLPARSRSSSRSRSRSRGKKMDSDSRQGREQSAGRARRNFNRGSRERSRERGKRDPGRHRKRGDSSSSSSSSDSSSEFPPATRLVASNKPKYLNSRLFVANIVSKEVSKEELTRHFEKYGNVVDVLVHPKNYAFIQYLREEHARLAVEGEQGSTMKGWRLDVKMASEGRKGVGGGGSSGGFVRMGRGGERGGRGGRYNSSDRDRSPLRNDPYMNPYRGGGPRSPGPYPPPLGDFGPYYPDPFRRGFPDPWLPPDDPFRRDPYLDPYRDPYAVRPLPPPPPVIECEVFLVNSQLRAYGEAVERRVKEQNIITAVSVIPEGRTAPQMVEELTARDGLFAIFINPQNEIHRSLTLNILHGVPQEHRNMPLDDAIALVGRSFEKYVEGLREKAKAASVPLTTAVAPISARVFLPASAEVAYLLNLLADNRALTVDELNTVIKYLQERRDKLIDAESRPIVTDGKHQNSPSMSSFQIKADNIFQSQRTVNRQPVTTQRSEISEVTPAPGGSGNKDLLTVQQDLKNKILSIFSNAGGSVQGVPPANGANQQFPSGTPAPPPPPPPAPPTSSASLINFDNPNVQKALDNLIQSSPNLLKNFSTKVSVSAPMMGVQSVTSSLGTGGPGAFGQAGGMVPGFLQGNQPQGGPNRMQVGGYGDMQGQHQGFNMQGMGGGQGNMGAQGPPRF
ncbi:unnamed protein product [Lymnaea stagnalis]|uniref:RRM domain-containing protein n=1 Tax=Lymnaea stagnalis TaxID=6523 RepID=A0AAV2H330_LYMST